MLGTRSCRGLSTLPRACCRRLIFSSRTVSTKSVARGRQSVRLSDHDPDLASKPRSLAHGRHLHSAGGATKRREDDIHVSHDYVPPSTGFLSLLPKPLLPYAELSRLDKPAGTAYLLMPCLFSMLMAACVASPIPDPSSVLYTATLFSLGAVTMRGAGCTINDLWDRNFDKLVSRTRLRPLARGAVSVPGAITWFCGQSLIGLAVLLQFPSNAVLLAVPSMLLVCTYPLAKRVTHFPQFVLGMAFSWGAFLGFPALGVKMVDFGVPASTVMDLVRDLPMTLSNLSLTISEPNVLISAGLLYVSCITWTLLYDTIYAFQDIKDDRKAGIKSTAQAFSTKGIAADLIDRKPKTVLAGLAVGQTGLLALSGFYLGLSPIFYATSCVGSLGTTMLMTRKVDLQDVKSCAWWFKMGCWITGGAISSGLVAEYAVRSSAENVDDVAET